jgi:ABC-2 type transport system ATP-binding protein
MVEAKDMVVQTVRLTKIFRDFWLRKKVSAVSELDLEIRPKEVFGLLGPNGSGKSTTLKMVLGLLFPTQGQIAVFGRRPTDVATKARIGFLPEESYLYPFLDAHETLDFYGRLFHQPRRERRRRIDMLLDMVGLSGVAYRRVGEYSKGMQRRIGLAQALINDPDLLILDEPTSGMDPIGTKQFKDLICTLAMRGKTVILSSHLLADVEDVCDRVCILYGGRKRAQGTLGELLSMSNRTQIITDRLDEATLAEIEKLVASVGKDVLEVAAPRDKLESLFLHIVEEAQQQRVRTGGATSGGSVAEFLRTGEAEGAAVIEQLVSASHPEPQAPEPKKEVPSPRVEENVLKELMTPAAEENLSFGASREVEAIDSPQADEEFISGLMGDDDSRKNGQEE